MLGLGTWHLAEDPRRRASEIASLRLGLDLGMTLVDTAEMYGEGAAEELVGEAIAGRRGEVFLVSKVLPHHATRKGTIAACEASLERLATDRLDLYLLHWRERVPLAETLAGFEDLVRAGKIRHWGVSNFDLSDLEELVALAGRPHARQAGVAGLADIAGVADIATDQVLYNLSRRGIEWDLLPWCRSRGVPIMAYSPIEQGQVLRHPALRQVAARLGATPAQVALAWVLRLEGVIAIPKAGRPEHVRENRAALDLRLGDEDLAMLDRHFPPPDRPRPLETL